MRAQRVPPAFLLVRGGWGFRSGLHVCLPALLPFRRLLRRYDERGGGFRAGFVPDWPALASLHRLPFPHKPLQLREEFTEAGFQQRVQLLQ